MAKRPFYTSAAYYGAQKVGRYVDRKINSYIDGSTQTKSQTNRSLASNQHTGVASTAITVVVNKKKPNHLAGQLRLFDGRSKIIKNRAGLQEVRIMNVIGAKPAWLTSTPANAVTDDDLSNYPMMAIDPNANNTGSTLITSSSSDSNNQQALLLSNVHITFDMTNTSTSGNYIWLYFITPKIDTDDSPITDWGESTQEIDFGAPAPVFPTPGLTDMAAASISTNQVGIRPEQFRLWNKKWRVLRVKKVELASGACEKVQVQLKPNYIGRADVMAERLKYMANKTVFVMALQHGTVCVDTSLDVSGVATYSESQTAVCSQLKYLLHPVKAKASKLDFAVGCSRIPIDATLLNQKLIDTEDNVNPVDTVSK